MPFEVAFVLAAFAAIAFALTPLTRQGLVASVALLVLFTVLAAARLSPNWGVLTLIAGLFFAALFGVALQGLRRVLRDRSAVTWGGALLSAAATVFLQYFLLMQA